MEPNAARPAKDQRSSLFSTLLALFLTAGYTESQITCFQYGNMTSCDGPRGQNSLQTDFGNGQGVIMDERGNVTPYAIMPPPSATRPSRPLSVLPKLPTLEQPRTPATPYALFEAPTAPLFMPGLGGEAGGAPH